MKLPRGAAKYSHLDPNWTIAHIRANNEVIKQIHYNVKTSGQIPRSVFNAYDRKCRSISKGPALNQCPGPDAYNTQVGIERRSTVQTKPRNAQFSFGPSVGPPPSRCCHAKCPTKGKLHTNLGWIQPHSLTILYWNSNWNCQTTTEEMEIYSIILRSIL